MIGVKNINMLRQRALQILRAAVFDLEQQSRAPSTYEKRDHTVHLSRRRRRSPSVSTAKRIERPEISSIALRRDHGLASRDRCDTPRPVVGAADMSRQHGYNETACTVGTDHGRIGIFIFQACRNTADTNTQRTDKHKRAEVMETIGHEPVIRGDVLTSFQRMRGINGGGCS